MKKKILLLSIIAVCLCGCSNSSVSTQEITDTTQTESTAETSESKEKNEPTDEIKKDSEKLTDADFVLNVSKGLEARWKISDQNDAVTKEYTDKNEQVPVSMNQKMYSENVNAEYDALGSFDDYTFSDSDLKELAENYFWALDQQKNGVQYLGVDDAKYNDTFMRGYYYRVKYICDLYNNYGMTVDDSYQSIMDEMIANNVFATEYVAVVTWIGATQENITFTQNEEYDSTTYKEYKAIIENTTDYDLTSVSVQIDILDESGIVVDQYTEYIDNFRTGSKYEITFTTDKALADTNTIIEVNF